MKKKGLDKASKEHVRDLLKKAPVARDQLPYSDYFQKLKSEFYDRTFKKVSDEEFWHILINVAKGGGIKGKQKVPGPKLTEEQKDILLRALTIPLGEIDNLPYTSKMSNLTSTFNRLSGLNMSEYEVWLALLHERK